MTQLGKDLVRRWFVEAMNSGSAWVAREVTVEKLLNEDDLVAVRYVFHGTHTGAFHAIPPTCRRIRHGENEIYRIADGRTVESWGEADWLGTMRQLDEGGRAMNPARLPTSNGSAVRTPPTGEHPSEDTLHGMTTRRRSGPVPVLLAAVLAVPLLSACDSRASSSPSPAALSQSTRSPRELPSTAERAAASEPSPVHAPPAGALAPIERVCQAITRSLSVLTTVAASPNDPSIAEGIAQLRGLRNTAPAEIRDDLQVIADFDDEMVATVRSGRSPAGISETPPLTRALSHEAGWTAAHCPH